MTQLIRGTLVVLLLASLFGQTRAQQIHNIPVPGSAGVPTLQQSLDEFWQYHQNSISYGVWRDNSYIQQNFTGTWPSQPSMQVWSEGGINNNYGSSVYDPISRFTSAVVSSYIRAYTTETNQTRRTAYYDKISKGLEFLLCLQSHFAHGGFPYDVSAITYDDSTYDSSHGTAFAGVALTEAYLAFGRLKILQRSHKCC